MDGLDHLKQVIRQEPFFERKIENEQRRQIGDCNYDLHNLIDCHRADTSNNSRRFTPRNLKMRGAQDVSTCRRRPDFSCQK
jgi:hypothetical protein